MDKELHAGRVRSSYYSMERGAMGKVSKKQKKHLAQNRTAFVVGCLLIVLIVVAGLGIFYSTKNKAKQNSQQSQKNSSTEDYYDPNATLDTPSDPSMDSVDSEDLKQIDTQFYNSGPAEVYGTLEI